MPLIFREIDSAILEAHEDAVLIHLKQEMLTRVNEINNILIGVGENIRPSDDYTNKGHFALATGED